MTTHLKLRPLGVYDSASSQNAFNDASSPDASPSVRAHCALPSATRGAKLVPAPHPPDTGSSASGEDTGVSKLRSKLRRLLGAHSSQAPAAQKASTTTPTLRCASTADLNDRPPPSANSSRTTSSVPVSPGVATPGVGPRGRFAGTAIVLPTSSVASTPPATPGSVGSTAPSPSIPPTSRSGPVPPAAATPSGAPPTPRCPSACSGRGNGPSLRRAVSFSPTATTFPPLGSPSVATPSPPPAPVVAPPPSNNGSGNGTAPHQHHTGALGGGVGAGAGAPAVRPGLNASGGSSSSSNNSGSSSSFVVAASRMSNMVVVPEDEALPEDPGQGDYCLSLSAGSIVGPPHRGPHLNELVFRNGRISAGDPDGLPAALASPPPADAAAYITSHAAVPGGGAAASLLPAPSPRFSPCAPQDAQRPTSSSNSSVVAITTGNGYIDGGGPGPAGPHALSATAPSAGLGSWSSDASASHGPFQSSAAVAALLETPPSPASSISSAHHYQQQQQQQQQHYYPQQLQQLRSPSFKSGARGPGSSESGRPPSSSSSSTAGAATAQRPAVFHHLPQTAMPGGVPPQSPGSGAAAAAAAAAGGHSHSPFSSAASAQLQLPNHTSVPPPLTRGMSAFNLLMAGGSVGGSRGAGSTTSPWNSVGGAGAALPAAAPAGAHPAAPAPEAPSTPTAAAAATAKTPTIRRAHSTIDNVVRSAPEAPSGPPGVLMALGASLPAEMKRKEWRVEDFTMLKRLYKGNYSAVHKALCRISMRLVVIKTYDTTRMTELARNHVKREACLHAPLEHDNILNLYAVFSQGPNVMLVEEVAEGGDLYHVLKSIPGHRLQEDRAVAGVLVPLLRALAHLHEQGICHRDIKLENILFSDRQHTRMLLADFGIALSLRQERAVTRAGTTEYMSPEQLRCPFKRHPSDNKERTDLHYGLGVDVWATGVLAFELLHGYPPFLGANREETEHLIMTAAVQVAPQLSHGARDFVLSCLQKDPADRPTVMQLLGHAWVRQHMRALR